MTKQELLIGKHPDNSHPYGKWLAANDLPDSYMKCHRELTEITAVDDELIKSIRTYKQDLIDHADYYKNQVSENAALWIDLLVRFSKRKFIKIKKVPNFRYGKVHKRTKRLMARIINDKQYLVSPNFSVINEIGESDIDFSKVSNINGIYFDYDEDDKLWKITCMNPYVVFT